MKKILANMTEGKRHRGQRLFGTEKHMQLKISFLAVKQEGDFFCCKINNCGFYIDYVLLWVTNHICVMC